jgi:hypothetical protein
VTRPDGLALVRAVREALATREGRTVVREIVDELRRADDEAADRDPAASYADELILKARRADRRARRGAR